MVEDTESEETDESEVDTEDTGTSGLGESTVQCLPSPSQCCTICFAGVSTGDVMVNCHVPQCNTTAHHNCAGYTARGAKRAKFLCPRCRANKLLAKPQKHRTHSPSPSTSASIPNKKDTATTINPPVSVTMMRQLPKPASGSKPSLSIPG